MPGLVRYMEPILVFSESHICAFLPLYWDLLAVKMQKGSSSVHFTGLIEQVAHKTVGS